MLVGQMRDQLRELHDLASDGVLDAGEYGSLKAELDKKVDTAPWRTSASYKVVSWPSRSFHTPHTGVPHA